MAVRPIDAVQVLHNINLHHRPTPLSEFESGFNDGLNQAMWEITHAPTLTQPNEHLTCDGCISLGTSYGPCVNCIRSRLRGDMYRRPPEGEEEEKHVIEITENL